MNMSTRLLPTCKLQHTSNKYSTLTFPLTKILLLCFDWANDCRKSWTTEQHHRLCDVTKSRPLDQIFADVSVLEGTDPTSRVRHRRSLPLHGFKRQPHPRHRWVPLTCIGVCAVLSELIDDGEEWIVAVGKGGQEIWMIISCTCLSAVPPCRSCEKHL